MCIVEVQDDTPESVTTMQLSLGTGTTRQPYGGDDGNDANTEALHHSSSVSEQGGDTDTKETVQYCKHVQDVIVEDTGNFLP